MSLQPRRVKSMLSVLSGRIRVVTLAATYVSLLLWAALARPADAFRGDRSPLVQGRADIRYRLDRRDGHDSPVQLPRTRAWLRATGHGAVGTRKLMPR